MRNLWHYFLLSLFFCSACSLGPEEKARFDLRITDAPIDDATSVFLNLTGIEIKPKGKSSIAYDLGQDNSIDLMSLPGSTGEYLLQGIELDPGEYSWVRLIVSTEVDGDSYINVKKNGFFSTHELLIDELDKSEIKTSSFSLKSGEHGDYTIDFDLRSSIVEINGEYVLMPHTRLIDNKHAAHVGGVVSGGLISANDCATKGAVYAYSGSDVVPGDVCIGDACDTSNVPLASSLVSVGTQVGNYYEIGFLPLGNYTLAYTCSSYLDDPLSNDSAVEFIDVKNVKLSTANTVERVDF